MTRFGIGLAATFSVGMLGFMGAAASEPVWSRTIGDILGDQPQQSVTAEPRTPASVKVEFLVEDRCTLPTAEEVVMAAAVPAPDVSPAVTQDAPPVDTTNANAVPLPDPSPVRPLPMGKRGVPIEISPSILYLP